MKYQNIEFEGIIATPGCGKSYLCDKFPERFVDVDEVRLKLKYVVPENITRAQLEETKGNRNFARRMHTKEYIQQLYTTLDEEVKKGKILIAAPHPESFEYFASRNIAFCFIYPNKGMREEIKNRFIRRGNCPQFIKENDDLFDVFNEGNLKENRAACHYVFTKNEYLEDILKKFGVKF